MRPTMPRWKTPWPACRMASGNADTLVRLGLDNPVFQANLLGLQKPKRHAAVDTLNKIRQLTSNQLYLDGGLTWEEISTIKPPPDIDAIYSLRITPAPRTTAYRDGDHVRLLKVAPSHESAQGVGNYKRYQIPQLAIAVLIRNSEHPDGMVAPEFLDPVRGRLIKSGMTRVLL